MGRLKECVNRLVWGKVSYVDETIDLQPSRAGLMPDETGMSTQSWRASARAAGQSLLARAQHSTRTAPTPRPSQHGQGGPLAALWDTVCLIAAMLMSLIAVAALAIAAPIGLMIAALVGLVTDGRPASRWRKSGAA